MPSRHDPSRPVHAEPVVAPLVGEGWLGGVHPDADAKLQTLRPGVRSERTLRRSGSIGGMTGAGEDVEEGVSLGIDLLAAVGGERLAQDPLVLGEDLAVALA